MSDSVASEPGRDSSPQAYRAELVESGCPHCGRGKEWKIAGPDGELERDYFDEDAARAVANQLNRAFENGMKERDSQSES